MSADETAVPLALALARTAAANLAVAQMQSAQLVLVGQKADSLAMAQVPARVWAAAEREPLREP